MRIDCRHGYYEFREARAGEVSDFITLFGLNLISKGTYFTFEELEDAPDFSIKGLDLLGIPATATFEGPPSEVFRENEFVFDFDSGLMKPIASITGIAPITAAGNYYISPGLLKAGQLNAAGERLTDFLGWFTTDTMKFRYSGVTFG